MTVEEVTKRADPASTPVHPVDAGPDKPVRARQPRSGAGPRTVSAPTPAWWRTAAGGAIVLLIGLALLALGWRLLHPLALIVLGIAVASALSPLVNWLDRWLPRAIAIVLLYASLFLVLGLISWVLLPPLFDQILAINFDAPLLLRQAQRRLAGWEWVFTSELAGTITTQLGRISLALLSLPLDLFSSLFEILLLLFISVYWLLEAPTLQRFVLSLLPEQEHERAEALLQEMGQAMGGYIRGVALVAISVALLMAIGLTLIGIEYALLFGLLAGLLEVIPLLGPFLAALPIVALALLDSPLKALAVVLFVIAVQQVENHILLPNIMRTQTAISPLLVILALLIGGTLAGLLGAMAAIPLVAALRVFTVRVLAPTIRQWTGASAEGLCLR